MAGPNLKRRPRPQTSPYFTFSRVRIAAIRAAGGRIQLIKIHVGGRLNLAMNGNSRTRYSQAALEYAVCERSPALRWC
jgi:hypothetical protein